MSASDAKAIHERIVERLNGKATLDLEGFSSLMRHLVYNVTEKKIEDFFKEIDVDKVGTIDTLVLTQDAEFAKRVLTALDESTNQTPMSPEEMADTYDWGQRLGRVASIDSPFATEKETDGVIAHLESELERIQQWKIQVGDPAVNEVADMREQIRVYQSDEKDLREKIEEMKQKLAQEIDVENDYKNDFDLLKVQHTELNAELATLTKNFELKKQECDRLQQQVSSFATTIETLQQSQLDLMQLNAEFERQNKKYKLDLEKKKKEGEKLEKEKTEIKKEMERVDEIETARIRSLQAEVKQLKEQLQSQETELTNKMKSAGSAAGATHARNRTMRFNSGGHKSIASTALGPVGGGNASVVSGDYGGFFGYQDGTLDIVDDMDPDDEVRREIEQYVTERLEAEMETKVEMTKERVSQELELFESKYSQLLKKMERFGKSSEKRLDLMGLMVGRVQDSLKENRSKRRRRKGGKVQLGNESDEGSDEDPMPSVRDRRDRKCCIFTCL